MKLEQYAIYQNKHTGKYVSLEKIETIANNPKPVIVCVLSDNTRWEKSKFVANHQRANPR